MISKTSINQVTGNLQVTTEAKLIQIAENPQANVNGTLYYPCTIEFVTKLAEVKTVPALMYAENYKYGVEVGKSYLCTVTKTDRGHLFTLSHLPARDMTTDEDFGFDEVEVSSDVEVIAGEDEGNF